MKTEEIIKKIMDEFGMNYEIETQWDRDLKKAIQKAIKLAQEDKYRNRFSFGEGFVSGHKEALEKVKKDIRNFKGKTFGDKNRIITEADLQSGEIEFSFTGELIPIEHLEGEFRELLKNIDNQQTKPLNSGEGIGNSYSNPTSPKLDKTADIELEESGLRIESNSSLRGKPKEDLNTQEEGTR